MAKLTMQCLALFVALIFVLTGSAIAATKKPITVAELALYRGADRQQLLEEGAKKEGKLTFYTSGILKQAVGPVIKAFEKKYPFIKVEVWRASNTSPRAVEEFKSGRHIFDVMESTQTDMLVSQETGIVQAYTSPHLGQIEDEAKMGASDGGFNAVAFRSSGLGVGYNTKLMRREQLPKTYHDLLDPKWRGKMAIAGSSTGVNWAACIYNNIGEDILKNIARQDFVVHMVSAQALLDMIINAEYAASPTIFDSHVFGSQKAGAPVAWIPLEPVRVNIGQIAMAKYAPHPYAALLFVDFELSKESGEIHRGMGYHSFRKDVPPLAQPYKKYFGKSKLADFQEEHDMFNKLFVKR